MATERALEALIRLCGISAILFVFGIFFFVFAGGVSRVDEPAFQPRRVPLQHRVVPDVAPNVRYGVLALIVGTFSVTALAMLIAVPFGLGAAIFVSEFCGRKRARR